MLSAQQSDAKAKAKAYFVGGPAAAMAAMGGESGAASPKSKNIIGIGIGPKLTDGLSVQGSESVHVYVRAKVPESELAAQDKVPPTFGSLATDVIEVGDVVAFPLLNTWQRYGRHRPLSCGISVGHPNITAGTIGCLVERAGTTYILSNNHVLADCNQAAINDAIIQQGTADGGSSPADNIANLSAFKPLDFTGAPNDIDAAIAAVQQNNTPMIVESEIVSLGRVGTTPMAAQLYQSVRKHGRTTGHTIGVIMDLSVDLWVSYRVGNTSVSAWFENQLGIMGVGSAPFSQGGDSGSLIVDAVSLDPVGLLFAGGGNFTYANFIDPVLSHFGVTMV